jgi:hypothetical protein
MFARSPPKMRLRLREGLETERLFEGVSGVDFVGVSRDVVATLTGGVEENSRAYLEIRSRLKAYRAGRVIRITVAAAEAVAAADFGPFVVMDSVALRDRFIVHLKARQRSVEYVIGRAGKTVTKKESSSSILDVYA